MLFLIFQLGKDRYALEAGQIVEVLPLVAIKHIPQALPGIAGALNYHGAPVPVIDLSQLSLGRPAEQRLSTRIILVRYPDAAGAARVLGVIAEKATDTTQRDAADFVVSGLENEAAAYLGPVATDAGGLLQRIDVQQLLPGPVRNALFQQPAGPQCPSPTSQNC